MNSPVTDERLKTILDGCEGITPGPWEAYYDYEGSYSAEFYISPTGSLSDAIATCPRRSGAYLARLDPATVAAMASELLAAREALKFYAEPTNYKGELVQGGTEDGVHTLTHHVNLVRKDGGQRARGALSGNRSGN